MSKPHVNLLLAIGATLATLALFLTVGRAEETRMAPRARSRQARAVEAGAGLYAEHCRSCHGLAGEGVGQLGPALNDREFFEERLDETGWQGTLHDYVAHTISMGRVVATRPLYAGDGNVAMPPWSQAFGGPLRPDEVQAVASFVLNWEAAAMGEFQPAELVLPTPERGSSREQAARGRQLFLDAGCGKCHAVAELSEGTGGPALSTVASAADTRVEGVSAEQYLRESFLIPDAFVVEGYAPRSGCGGVLTYEQLDDLVSFLLTLR